MTDFSQIPFEAGGFADNPEPRCPCLLLLDTSHSMQGQPIAELNKGLQVFKDELATDSLAMKRVEIAIITFGPVTVVSDFQTPDNFHPAPFSTTGNTPMGEAIQTGLEMLRRRKDAYRAHGISYYRPWIFLITDGSPTDDWTEAARLVKDGENSGGFSFFPVAVQEADLNTLRQIATREPLKLDGLKFRQLFSWLSSSLSKVSQSQVGQRVALPPPAGWTEV